MFILISSLFKLNIFVQAVNIYLRDVIYLVKLFGTSKSVKRYSGFINDLTEIWLVYIKNWQSLDFIYYKLFKVLFQLRLPKSIFNFD